MNRRKSLSGFTLAEVLIVVAIIVLLVSIVLVSLLSAREKAKVASFKAATHSLQSAAIMSCDRNSTLNSATLPVGNASIVNTTLNFVNQNCGPAGTGSFNVVASSLNLMTTCTARISPTGVTYNGC